MKLPPPSRPWRRLTPLVAGWVLLLIGAFAGLINVQDEIRQKTHHYPVGTVRHKDNLEDFRLEMGWHWVLAAIYACPGLILLSVYRRYNRLDPFSSTFRGKKSLDDLDEWLDRENDKQHRPLR
jgi:hypothetical protein